MGKYFSEQEVFQGINFTETELSQEYEQCIFTNCILNHVNLSDITFTECTFKDCDLSMATVLNTSFREVTFIQCKSMGVRFEDCREFMLSFHFEGCNLSYASFHKLNLKSTIFQDCQLLETIFTESDLTKAEFQNCDLKGAIFEYTNLEQADFHTAINYSIDPEKNRIRGAKFSTMGLKGLLEKYDILVE